MLSRMNVFYAHIPRLLIYWLAKAIFVVVLPQVKDFHQSEMGIPSDFHDDRVTDDAVTEVIDDDIENLKFPIVF